MRLFPTTMVVPEQDFRRKYSREELDVRFDTIRWVFNFSMVVVGVLLAIGMYTLLVRTNRYLALKDGPAQFVIFPQSAIWWFLPGFAALTLAFEITLQLWSIFGDRSEADLYGYWSGLGAKIGLTPKADLDVRRILRWMAPLIVLPIAGLTFLASAAVALRDGFGSNPYFRALIAWLYAPGQTHLQCECRSLSIETLHRRWEERCVHKFAQRLETVGHLRARETSWIRCNPSRKSPWPVRDRSLAPGVSRIPQD